MISPIENIRKELKKMGKTKYLLIFDRYYGILSNCKISQIIIGDSVLKSQFFSIGNAIGTDTSTQIINL